MKKQFFVIAILLFICNISFAQPREKLKAQRVAYITQRVEMTPGEAEKFWPLYNQFDVEKKAINKKYKRDKRLVNMTDKELEQQMQNNFAKDQELLDLKKDYFEKFKEVLPIRKVVLVTVAEREFRKTIVEKVRGNMQGRQQQRERRQQNNRGK